jgi:hypothetical protein
MSYFWERNFGNVFTEPLPSNGHMRHNIKSLCPCWICVFPSTNTQHGMEKLSCSLKQPFLTSASFNFRAVSADKVSSCLRDYRFVVYILVVKTKGTRPVRRARRRWKDIRIVLREMGSAIETKFICLRIGTSGGLLWARQWTFIFHKMLEILG